MISRYEVMLNGKPLAEVDENILILDVGYPDERRKIDSFKLANRDGSRYHSEYKETSSVDVSFQIRAYAIEERQEICQKVIKWAKDGGWLTINDRPGKRLNVRPTSYPTVTSVQRWTDTLSISFAAYNLPYWQDEEPTTVTLTGTAPTEYLDTPGSISKARVEVSITADADITSLTVSAGETRMNFSGLTIREGQTVTIGYANDILSIKVGKTSILSRRTGDDDLLVDCGERSLVGFTANGACTATFSVRGLWE